MYYNTLNETNPELSASIKQTEKQDAKVLNFFKANPYKNFTPFEVMRGCEFKPEQKFSVARSINTLTNKGLLIKLPKELMRMGEMGKKNYCWSLKIEFTQTNLFND